MQQPERHVDHLGLEARKAWKRFQPETIFTEEFKIRLLGDIQHVFAGIADVLAALDLFEAEGIEAIAICLFNSFLNADHERRVEELVRAKLPSSTVSLSSAIAPIMGEYERGITAVLNAYVAPRTLRYLRAMNLKLTECSLKAPFVLIPGRCCGAP